MAYKNVLNNNRVFLDPGNVTIEGILEQNISLSGTITTILINDTTDFSESGYILIGAEQFYYSGKTATTFTGVTRAVKNTSQQAHSIDDVVYQARPSLTNNTDNNLAGWYVDGKSNQASLRVRDSSVIQEGVIRFVPPDGVNPGVFQGCVNSSPIEWQTFNALQGPPGAPGIIDSIISFENVDDTSTTTTNVGAVMKTLSLNTLPSPPPAIEVRSIVSGTKSINGQTIDIMGITQTSNEIVCFPQPQPFTWNMTDTIANLKGFDLINNQAYTWAQTVSFPVVSGSIPESGQIVVSYINSGKLCVRPLTFSSPSDLLGTASPPINLGIVGVCINNPTVGNPVAIIATSGIALVKIKTDASPFTEGTSATTNYSGIICYVNGTGYGVNFTNPLTPPYAQIGIFLENTSLLTNNSSAIVRLDPRIIIS